MRQDKNQNIWIKPNISKSSCIKDLQAKYQKDSFLRMRSAKNFGSWKKEMVNHFLLLPRE